MMTSNGGFQSYYPPSGGKGYNSHTFHRSNTYIPPNPYSNPPQPYAQQSPFQHTNTYAPQPPNIYMPPPQPYTQRNSYVPPPPQPYTQSNSYVPPPPQPYTQRNSYVPPPPQPLPSQNIYSPPPAPQPMPPQDNYIRRSYTTMATSPSPLNPPQQELYIPPPPQQSPELYMPPPQQPQQPYVPPPQEAQQLYIPPPPPPQNQQLYIPPPQQPYAPGLPKLQRANTYCPPPRPRTVYDNLNITPTRFAPQVEMNKDPRSFNSNFNPEEDCKILREAVHGFGTDNRSIINIIINRNRAQRQEIRRTYKACFGKDLIKRLKEDTSGNFKQIISAMFMSPAEYDAYCLYKAMKGLGTDEGVLIEIIGTRNNQQLREIQDIFEKEYKSSLEKWIKGDTSGNFKLLLIALLQCNRSNNTNPDVNVCQADAQALYNAGEGRWGTDEATFIRIFANRSAAEMACINQCYLRLRGKGLLKAIDKEFSGDIKKLLQTVVGGLLDPAGYFASRVREAVKGLGTNNAKLVRVIVSRYEIDLGYIKDAYQKIYHRDMLYDVRDDTSGYYRDVLTGLISRS